METKKFISLPFLQPNIVHEEGAITSDAIGSLWADENKVQSGKIFTQRENKNCGIKEHKRSVTSTKIVKS